VVGSFTENVKRRLGRIAETRPELIFLVNYVGHLLVERPQGNIRRACLAAQAAVYAPARHVKCAGQVENRAFRRQGADIEQVSASQRALGTVAHRADVPASVAFNAFGELAEPALKTFVEADRINPRNAFELPGFSGLPGNAVIGERLHALAGVGQSLRAGDTD
jgi:hypothetical protein